MTNDWLVTLKFKNMPEDADEASMRMFVEVMFDSYEAEVFQSSEIVKIERVSE